MLVASKIDRLSRSLLDFVTLTERAKHEGWGVVALDVGVDTTTPTGRMQTNLLAVFGEFERDMISARTRDALRVKREQGVRLGRPRTVSDKTVSRILTLREAGDSYAAIAEALNGSGTPTAQGGRQWWPATVRAVAQAALREPRTPAPSRSRSR